RQRLSDVRLTLGSVDTVQTRDSIEAVFAQRPPPGSEAPSGSQVSIFLGRPEGRLPLPSAGSASDSAFVNRMVIALLGKYSPEEYQIAMKELLGGTSRADLIVTMANRAYQRPGDQVFLRNLWRLVACQEPSDRDLANLSAIDKRAYSGSGLAE